MESEEFNKFGAAEIINIPEDMELSQLGMSPCN